jgi:hypothetical protein
VSIKEPELAILRDEAVEACNDALARLAHDKISNDLTGGDYFLWLGRMLDNAGSGSTIRAVSTIHEADWTAVTVERRFLEANVASVQRGAKIERIFITTRKRLAEATNQTVVREHIAHLRDGLTAYIVWQEDVALREPTLLTELGSGFITFDDRVAFVDGSQPPDEVTGIVTMNGVKLRSLRRVFDRLLLHAEPATPEHFTGQSAQSDTAEVNPPAG